MAEGLNQTGGPWVQTLARTHTWKYDPLPACSQQHLVGLGGFWTVDGSPGQTAPLIVPSEEGLNGSDNVCVPQNVTMAQL